MSGPRIIHGVTSPLTITLMRGQLAYLRNAGFEVSVISAPGGQLDQIQADEHVTAIAVPMQREIAPTSDLASLWRLYRLFLRNKPALVNSGTPKAGLLMGVAAWLARVPCRVHTLRGVRSDTAKGWKRRVLLAAERISCRTAHLVLCNSESLRRRAIALGLTDAQRSLVLAYGSSNGVDVGRFAATESLLSRASELRGFLEIPPDAPVIGFVGRLTRDKGIADVVAAFDRIRSAHPGLRLLLIGDYEAGDPLPPDIKQRLDQDPDIICTGAVADAAPYYQLMTVYCLPTYREGFPNSVLEAHASGLPVVTTTATGAVDSVQDGVTGLLVPPGDPAPLAAALERLLADPIFATRMGAAGRERVTRDFRPEVVWGALGSLYRDLLRQRGIATAADAAVPTR